MSGDERGDAAQGSREAETLDLDEVLWRLVRSIADLMRLAELRMVQAVERASGTGRTPWMTTEQAAKHSGIPEGTFERLASAGSFRRYRPGKKGFIFHRDELDEDLRRFRA